MATAKATTNHDEIRKWVEARKGHPARVKATGRGKDPGILRIDFPGFSGEDTLEEIEWDEFFEWFDRNNLALLLSSERGNRFNKLVARPASARKSSASKKSASKKSSSKKASSAKKSSAKKATSAKKSSGSKKSSASTKKAATSSKKASSSTKKASSAKKAAPSKKATSSKKSTSKKSTTKASSTTRRLVAAKAPARKSTKKTSSKKASTGGSKTTTDHDEIRKWVEARGGFPATVAGTEKRDDEAGVLRIDYPGFSGAGTLERIDWDDWFEKFDEEDLAFVYQDKRNSRFSKLVRR
jgi:hypothetical protein